MHNAAEWHTHTPHNETYQRLLSDSSRMRATKARSRPRCCQVAGANIAQSYQPDTTVFVPPSVHEILDRTKTRLQFRPRICYQRTRIPYRWPSRSLPSLLIATISDHTALQGNTHASATSFAAHLRSGLSSRVRLPCRCHTMASSTSQPPDIYIAYSDCCHRLDAATLLSHSIGPCVRWLNGRRAIGL